MNISIQDSDGVMSIHIPDRLEADLTKGDGVVENMKLVIYFKIKTILPSGKVVGEPYLDFGNPLLLNCKGNPELTQAMLVIQQAIGKGRNEQVLAQTQIPEPTPDSGMMSSLTQP